MNIEKSNKQNFKLIETNEIPVEWLYELAIREGNSKKPIYQIHKWWARRLSSVFRALLLMALNDGKFKLQEFFYKANDHNGLVVLDPFMGGGTSIIEACKVNANTIGIDIDPIAWFTTKKEVDLFNSERVVGAYKKLEEAIGREIYSYYLTKVDNKTFPVTYYFWVDLIKCPQCNTIFETHPHYILTSEENKQQQTVFCKYCHNVMVISTADNEFVCQQCNKLTNIKNGTIQRGKYNCPNCSHTGKIVSTVEAGVPLEKRLFALEYTNEMGLRQYKRAEEFDLSLYEKAKKKLEEQTDFLPYPRQKIPTEKRSDARPVNLGFEYYYQLFNARQLLCLSLLWNEIQNLDEDINTKEYIVIAFSDSLASNNMLCRYAFGYQKLTPLFGIHAYDVVHRPVENNVWGTRFGRGSFSKCIYKMLRGKEYSEKPFEFKYENGRASHVFTGEKISRAVSHSLGSMNNGYPHCIILNQSSVDLELLAEDSVDLILTDPPYYDNLSYSELSDFYYVWIRDYMPKDGDGDNHISTPYRDALFANGKTGNERFVDDLALIFSHCKRVLKPDGLMIFTFHHRKLQAWTSLAKSLAIGGFYITNVFPVRSEGKSGFHSSEGTIKWDSVIVCRNRGDLKTNNKPRYQQEIILEKINYWKNRLNKAGLSFREIDAISLGYSLVMENVIYQCIDPNTIHHLMSGASKSLVSLWAEQPIEP